MPQLLEHLDHTYRTMPQAFAEKPSDTFKRHFWMHPFHEEDPRELVELLGADHVIFGSDYPHVEGLADPLSYIDELVGLPEEDISEDHGRQHDGPARDQGACLGLRRVRPGGPAPGPAPGPKRLRTLGDARGHARADRGPHERAGLRPVVVDGVVLHGVVVPQHE